MAALVETTRFIGKVLGEVCIYVWGLWIAGPFIYNPLLVFCSWTVCTLIIQEPGEGGKLETGATPPCTPLFPLRDDVAEDLFLCVRQTLFPNKLRLLSWVRSHSPSESSKPPKNRVKSHSKENKQYLNILLIKTTQSMEKLYNHFK